MIATVYTEDIELAPLIWAAGLFAVVLVLPLGFGCAGPLYFVLGARSGSPCSTRASSRWWWASRSASSCGPPRARSDLEEAGERFREFREQPTPELQRSVRESIRTAIPPNERLQLSTTRGRAM